MTLILSPTDQRFCTAVAKDPNAPKRGDPGFFDSIPDRGSRYPSGPGGAGANPREELPLPSKPPYTAFVGNLTFECTEQELGDMFADMETNSVKIIRGHDEKPKGFGYVEFKTLDGLKDALTRTGMQVMGRSIRVSVAEPPKSSSGGFGGFGGPSMADSADQWRRAGPLPPRSPPRSNTRTFSSSRFGDSDAPSGPPAADRDWSAARGSKFAAGAEPPAREGGGLRRDFVPAEGRGERGDRGGERRSGPVSAVDALAETPNDWRSNRPARAEAPVTLAREASTRPAGAAGGGPRTHGFVEREPVQLTGGAAEETWTRGTKFAAAPAPIEKSAEDKPAPAAPRAELDQSNWRSSKPASKEPTREFVLVHG